MQDGSSMFPFNKRPSSCCGNKISIISKCALWVFEVLNLLLIRYNYFEKILLIFVHVFLTSNCYNVNAKTVWLCGWLLSEILEDLVLYFINLGVWKVPSTFNRKDNKDPVIYSLPKSRNHHFVASCNFLTLFTPTYLVEISFFIPFASLILTLRNKRP